MQSLLVLALTSVRNDQLAGQGQRHDGVLVHQSRETAWGERGDGQRRAEDMGFPSVRSLLLWEDGNRLFGGFLHCGPNDTCGNSSH